MFHEENSTDAHDGCANVHAQVHIVCAPNKRHQIYNGVMHFQNRAAFQVRPSDGNSVEMSLATDPDVFNGDFIVFEFGLCKWRGLEWVVNCFVCRLWVCGVVRIGRLLNNEFCVFRTVESMLCLIGVWIDVEAIQYGNCYRRKLNFVEST